MSDSLEKEIETDLAWLELRDDDKLAEKIYETIISGYSANDRVRGIYLRMLWRIQMDRTWPKREELVGYR